MKPYFIALLVMVLTCVNGHASNSSPDVLPENIEINIHSDQLVELETIGDLNNVVLSNITEKINSDFSCTRSIKVYVPTTAGVIGFGLSITADTCEEADAGLSDAVRGFVNELM